MGDERNPLRKHATHHLKTSVDGKCQKSDWTSNASLAFFVKKTVAYDMESTFSMVLWHSIEFDFSIKETIKRMLKLAAEPSNFSFLYSFMGNIFGSLHTVMLVSRAMFHVLWYFMIFELSIKGAADFLVKKIPYRWISPSSVLFFRGDIYLIRMAKSIKSLLVIKLTSHKWRTTKNDRNN